MKENIYKTHMGEIQYLLKDNCSEILKYNGDDIELEIPDEIHGKQVKIIRKKAFLSNKKLKQIILPKYLDEIEGWAFTYCDQLRQIIFPQKHIEIGRNIFSGNKHLQSIQIIDSNGKYLENGLDYMLASTVNAFGTYQFLTFDNIGTEEWMKNWDERLLLMMKQDDFEGFADLLICGEEDYEGKDYDEKSYPSRKRKGKVRIAMFRLIHDQYLGIQAKEELKEYLKNHTCLKHEDEAWQVLKNEKSNDLDYFQVFKDAGCIQQENIDKMIMDLSDEQIQLRVALLNYKNEKFAIKDCFDEFEL